MNCYTPALLYFDFCCLVLQDGKQLVAGCNLAIDRVAGRCSLHISAVTGDDEAEYLCEARNEHGLASTVQQLLVNCTCSLQSCLPPTCHCVLTACVFACFDRVHCSVVVIHCDVLESTNVCLRRKTLTL